VKFFSFIFFLNFLESEFQELGTVAHLGGRDQKDCSWRLEKEEVVGEGVSVTPHFNN
jgi:hypothetical protein